MANLGSHKGKRILLIILGCLGLAMGAVGAVLPFLPAFPFLMLAAVCFGKSSSRLDAWFRSTRLYRENLADYVRGQGMPVSAKIRVLLLISLLFGLGIFFMRRIPIGQAALALIWLFHIVYFVWKVPTKKTKTAPEAAERT